MLIFLIFLFLIHSVAVNWSRLPPGKVRLQVGFFSLSLFFLLGSSLLGNLAWWANLRIFGERIRFLSALRVIGIAQMGKYIPGKVWSVGGRVLLAKEEGISEVTTSASVLVETLSLSLAASVLFLIFLANLNIRTHLPPRFFLSFLFIPLSLFFLHPRVLKKAIIFGGKILKRPVTCPELKLAKIILVYLLYLLSWFVHTTGFFFLVRSIYPVPFTNFFGVVGSFSIAWVLSFLILFVPGGFGFREGILTFFLKFFLPTPVAALLSLIGRLWTTLGEVAILTIAILLRPKEFWQLLKGKREEFYGKESEEGRRKEREDSGH